MARCSENEGETMAKKPLLPFYMSSYYQTEMKAASKRGELTDKNRLSVVARIKREMKALGIRRKY